MVLVLKQSTDKRKDITSVVAILLKKKLACFLCSFRFRSTQNSQCAVTNTKEVGEDRLDHLLSKSLLCDWLVVLHL